MGVPGTRVGSRWLECLTPNPHASLFRGSMLPRLHICMSALTHSDQVFIGLPLLALGIIILVMEFMHEEEHATCPYHLKRLVRRAAVTSCTLNIAQSVSVDTSSSSLTPQIQRTIDLSFQQSRCKSGAVGAQISLPCNRAERTQALKTFLRVLRDTCSDVRIGRSLLNFPQAVLHLVTMASLHPPPAHSMSSR